MRVPAHVLPALMLAVLIAPCLARAQKQMAQSPKILAARNIYFDNQTGSEAVGEKTLEQLKKWGKYVIVRDKKQADLILLLSSDPYDGGYIVFASGQTGTIDNGHVEEDGVPNYNRQAPVRYAYLSVIDPKTGDNLWSDKHVWGGLLTGVDSVGERLVKELRKQVGK